MAKDKLALKKKLFSTKAKLEENIINHNRLCTKEENKLPEWQIATLTAQMIVLQSFLTCIDELIDICVKRNKF